MLKNQRLTLALALALGSSQVLALGLGSIDVRTRLNEPLVAEIPIVGSSDGELSELRVRLASPEAFERIGLDRPAIVSANLEFSIDKSGEAPVIRVTTPSKIRDPYLSFLLEIEWGRGRLLREYTVLLDPPVTALTRVAPAPQIPSVAETAPVLPAEPSPAPEPLETPAPLPSPAPTPAPAPAAPPVASTAPAEPEPLSPPAPSAQPEPQPAPAATPAAARQDSYGPVREGETLWSIAEFARPNDAVSMNQVMLALLAANPEAFIDENIHRLKRGAVLRIPTEDEVRAISEQAAAAQVIEQTREWRARSGAVQQPAGQDRVGSGASAAAPTDARLELVPPAGERASRAQSGATEGGEGSELRADLSRAREQLSTLEQENRELRSRVSDLERLEGDSKRLIELKDSELAAAQARVAELEAALQASATAPAGPADKPPAAAAMPADAGLAEDLPAEDAAAAGETLPEDALVDVSDALDAMDAGDQPSPASEALPAEDSAPAETAPIDAAPAPAESAQPAWYSNPMILGGVGGLVLLGGLVAWLSGRSKKKPAPKPARASSVADSFGAAPVSAAAASVAAEEQGDGEAQTLVDAIAEQPDDLNRHLALVRHYYEQGDASGFEGAAEAMYAQLFDPEDLSWKQVLAMGRELLPDHPLFAAAQEGSAEWDDAGEDRDRDTSYRQDLELDDADLTDTSTGAGREEVDWGGPAADAGKTQAFSVDEIERLAEDSHSITQELPAVSADRRGDTDDFELGAFDGGSDGTAGDSGPAPLTELDFDGDAELADTQLDGDDAAATKLELARAYLDMGDVEGARGMLEEVVNEGNAGQRSEAKRLLDEIR
jgi:pilus assembly protein FimV